MKSPGLRWWIVGLLFLAAVLNYVDKNTLALLAPTIQRDLNLNDQDYANIQNAFQVAYTIALLASGAIVDKLGPRLSLALFVGWWSLANVFTSLARSVTSLSVFRFLLGLGEAGNWTASPKTVSEWFPAKERGLAIGIYTAGTPIGMTLAPLFIIWLAEAFGWRSAFVVTGLMGLVWLAPWLLLYRSPRAPSEAISLAPAEGERAGVRGNSNDTPTTEPGWTWLQAFGRVEVWCLLVGRMLSDPIWFFYQNWYPKYLVSARGLTQTDVKITWVMFLAAGLGSLLGGWIAGRFIKQGRAPERVRLFVMLGCALFMPLSPLVALVPSVGLSLAVASLIVFAHLAWLINISALVLDVVPRRSLGTVFGIVAAGSSVGAIVMNDLVAKLVKHHSYTNWFWIAACLHLTVFPLVTWGVLRRKPQAPNSNKA
ncbi:MAG: MFS transporter [Verrucomicrobia bacterium]|nr:MFS transporter [Verrucomicrobiota bacterium]